MPTDVHATTLVTLDEVRRYVLGDATDTSRDDRLVLQADAASARIEQHTGRVFAARSVTESFRGNGSAQHVLLKRPVISLASVTIGGAAVAGSAWEIEADLGRVTLTGTTFTPGALCVVVYRAGYEPATLPRDLVELCLQLTKYLWDERENGAVLASSVSIGGQSLVVKSGLPEPFAQALRPWCDTRF
jgi:hypothetical protein